MNILLSYLMLFGTIILLIIITIAIIVNFPIIKKKLDRKTIYLLEISGSILALIMIVDGAIMMLIMDIHPLQVEMLPIWVAMVVLIMVIVRFSCDYQKIKKEETDKIMKETLK